MVLLSRDVVQIILNVSSRLKLYNNEDVATGAIQNSQDSHLWNKCLFGKGLLQPNDCVSLADKRSNDRKVQESGREGQPMSHLSRKERYQRVLLQF